MQIKNMEATQNNDLDNSLWAYPPHSSWIDIPWSTDLIVSPYKLLFCFHLQKTYHIFIFLYFTWLSQSLRLSCHFDASFYTCNVNTLITQNQSKESEFLLLLLLIRGDSTAVCYVQWKHYETSKRFQAWIQRWAVAEKCGLCRNGGIKLWDQNMKQGKWKCGSSVTFQWWAIINCVRSCMFIKFYSYIHVNRIHWRDQPTTKSLCLWIRRE